MKDFSVIMLQTQERIWINRAHPIGSENQNDGPIIANLPDDGDINCIMNNVKRLKRTGYVVHRDYTQAVRIKRSQLIEFRKEIEKKSGQRKMLLIFYRLVVEGCSFT